MNNHKNAKLTAVAAGFGVSVRTAKSGCVAIVRTAYTAVMADETAESAVEFLWFAVA